MDVAHEGARIYTVGQVLTPLTVETVRARYRRSVDLKPGNNNYSSIEHYSDQTAAAGRLRILGVQEGNILEVQEEEEDFRVIVPMDGEEGHYYTVQRGADGSRFLKFLLPNPGFEAVGFWFLGKKCVVLGYGGVEGRIFYVDVRQDLNDLREIVTRSVEDAGQQFYTGLGEIMTLEPGYFRPNGVLLSGMPGKTFAEEAGWLESGKPGPYVADATSPFYYLSGRGRNPWGGQEEAMTIQIAARPLNVLTYKAISGLSLWVLE